MFPLTAMRATRVVVGAAPLATLAAICLLAGGPSSSRASASQTRSRSASWTAIAVPSKSVLVAPPQAGILAECRVSEGTRVEVGEILGSLDSDREELRARRLALIAESDADVRAARERLTFAKDEGQRARELSEQEIVNRAIVDKLAHQTKLAEIELERAELDHASARFAWEEARVIVQQRTLRSPIAGIVTRKLKEVGEATEELEPVFEVVTLDPLWVEFHCPLADARSFTEGSRLRVRQTDDASRTKVGTVIHASQTADPSSHTFRVRLEVPNDRSVWRAGLKVMLEPLTGPAARPGK